jgi:hypothetical protein
MQSLAREHTTPKGGSDGSAWVLERKTGRALSPSRAHCCTLLNTVYHVAPAAYRAHSSIIISTIALSVPQGAVARAKRTDGLFSPSTSNNRKRYRVVVPNSPNLGGPRAGNRRDGLSAAPTTQTIETIPGYEVTFVKRCGNAPMMGVTSVLPSSRSTARPPAPLAHSRGAVCRAAAPRLSRGR